MVVRLVRSSIKQVVKNSRSTVKVVRLGSRVSTVSRYGSEEMPLVSDSIPQSMRYSRGIGVRGQPIIYIICLPYCII